MRIALTFLTLVLLACTMMPKVSRTPAQSAGCRGYFKLRKQFTVQDIRMMLLDPEIRTVEDMLSCLARDLDMQVLLVHTSMAAQNSDSLNPRALAFVLNDDSTVRAAFTVNSGEPHLVQEHAVEFMYNDNTKHEVEYYDIPFHNNRGKLSAANPSACMNCHGNNGKVPLGGPKTLFDRDPWPRIVAKFSSFTPTAHPDILCPVRRKAHYALDNAALEAYQTKVRYAPLQQEDMADVFPIDREIRRLNARRVAKWITKTEDYQTFKFAIFGAAFGCFNYPEKFIPEKFLSTMSNVSRLHERVQKARTSIDLENHFHEQFVEQWRENLAGDKLNEPLLKDLAEGRPVYFRMHIDGSRACEAPPVRNFGNTTEVRPVSVFDKYQADPLNADIGLRRFRFLFESRGMDISDWDTQPRPGYGRSVDMMRPYLLELEPSNSTDYKVMKEISALRQFEACPRLEELSYLRMSNR